MARAPHDSESLTTGQRERLGDEIRAELLTRFRVSLLAGIAMTLVLAGVMTWAYPQAPGWAVTGAPLVAGVLCPTMWALTHLPLVARRIGGFSVAFGTAVVACVSAAAAHSGGFSAPIISAVFVIWISGAAVFPLPARLFALGVLFHLATLTGGIYVLSPSPGSPLVYSTIALAASGMCVIGGFLREAGRLRLFVAQESLAQLNASLEQRVKQQVEEIVARAREVDVLNVQLQAKVRQRSRDLDEALRRLSQADDQLPGPGEEIGGRVKLVRLLGQGGMGAVYLANDLLTNEQVAVKLMRPGIIDPTALRRFVGEAGAAAAITHPGVVKTLHVDVTAGGRFYLIMQYVEGPTLARLFAGRALPGGEAARLGAVLAEAIAAAHAAGVVHRDLKPANLIACRREPAVRVLDFGLSKVREPGSSDGGLTRAHQVMGTPRYMSPEQVEDVSAVTAATDVYSLGLIVYELAAGRSPFTARTAPEYLLAHVRDEPADPPGAPERVARAVMACLAKDPAARPTAADLARRLAAAADEAGAPPASEIVRRDIDTASEMPVAATALAPTMSAPSRSAGDQ